MIKKHKHRGLTYEDWLQLHISEVIADLVEHLASNGDLTLEEYMGDRVNG